MLLPMLLVVSAQGSVDTSPKVPDSISVAAIAGEPNLANVRKLTFGGQNAEAYWSADGKKISYQAQVPGGVYPDEQIFTMNADGSNKWLVSTGKGRCTCAYYSPDGKYIYFSSTHARNPGAQAPVDMSKGYVWAINPDYELYRVSSEPITVLTEQGSVKASGEKEKVLNFPGTYVAETTIAPDGKYMVWTSDKDGDLDIYRSDLDGKNIKKLTDSVGYDGGPFVSWDSKKIVYRRDAFDSDAQVQDYKDLLKSHMIRPTKLEIWVMDADGSNKRQVTHLGCASFAPFMHPDGKRIIFSSNYGDPKGREFDIFMIDIDGNNLRRITKSPEFDGFPMFSRDGKKLVFASNRYGKEQGETNVFVADWKD
jgi:Tol biopolymer transport system component